MKDASTECKKYGLWHVRISMDKTLEARLICRDSVVLDVQCYCGAYLLYVVRVASLMLCACIIVYIWCV